MVLSETFLRLCIPIKDFVLGAPHNVGGGWWVLLTKKHICSHLLGQCDDLPGAYFTDGVIEHVFPSVQLDQLDTLKELIGSLQSLIRSFLFSGFNK